MPSRRMRALGLAGVLLWAAMPAQAQAVVDAAAQRRFAAAVESAQQGQGEAARTALEALRRELGERPEILNNLAVLQARAGRMASALELLKLGAAQSPHYLSIVQNMQRLEQAAASAAGGAAAASAQALSLIESLPGSRPAVVAAQAVAAASAAPLAAPMAAADASAAAPAPAPAPPMATTLALDMPRSTDARSLVPLSAATGGDPAAAAQQALEAAVLRWAGLWSAGDTEGYLAMYHPDFQPEGGLKRKAWERQRRQRVQPQRVVHVEVTELQYFPGEPQTIVRLTQWWKVRGKPPLKSLKELAWVRDRTQEQPWRIVRETVLSEDRLGPPR